MCLDTQQSGRGGIMKNFKIIDWTLFYNKYLRNSSATDQPTENENRSKRGALELYSMIKCATGCDPLIFKGYGCYCGFLGSGHTLDGIDRCVQLK